MNKQRRKSKNIVHVVRTLHGLSHKAAVEEAMKARVEIARLSNELHAAQEKNLVAAKELAEELIATRLETGEYVTKEQLHQVEETSLVYQRCFEQHGERIRELELEKLQPIPMRIPCPDCGELHIDEGEFATKAHHTHSCQKCGLTWRPAVRATVGVRFLPGFTNPTPAPQVGEKGDDEKGDDEKGDVAHGPWMSATHRAGKYVVRRIHRLNDDAIGISWDTVK